MLRKKLAVLLAATMVVATMAGCGAKEEAAAPAEAPAATDIIFYIYLQTFSNQKKKNCYEKP